MGTTNGVAEKPVAGRLSRQLDPLSADRSQAYSIEDNDVLQPVLSDRQIEEISRIAKCRKLDVGEILFEQGTRNADVAILQEGRLEFYDRRRDRDVLITEVSRRTFIGDISMFTGEPTIAACVAVEPSKVMIVGHEDLKRLIAEHSEIGDLILKTFMARRERLRADGHGLMSLVGHATHGETYRMRDFLERNQIPLRFSDPDDDAESRVLLDKLGIVEDDLPVLICTEGVCRHPNIEEVARRAGLRPKLKTCYDLIVVGGGPAGLAATVYGASEGLDTLMIDKYSPGGQAGTSSKIENYLGFATGVSGDELSKQAVLQARKFGATLCNPCTVIGLDCEHDKKTLTLHDGTQIMARSIVLATGARYRKLPAENGEAFDGCGVYYACGHVEASGCRNKQTVVIGGGNSAGQAAVFLSRHARDVKVIIRGDDLGKSMSDYLVRRIREADNIELLAETEVARLDGDGRLQSLTLTGKHAGTVDCDGLFVMIGATPNTEWLDGGDCVGLCPKGFLATGIDARHHAKYDAHWSGVDREPFLLETTRPGVFAAGDVRAGSVKRVAGGVGEGSMAIAFVHKAIAEQKA
ncbi:MAG: FAD-dependent oxidoreductase [Planctomycetota bacterium]